MKGAVTPWGTVQTIATYRAQTRHDKKPYHRQLAYLEMMADAEIQSLMNAAIHGIYVI